MCRRIFAGPSTQAAHDVWQSAMPKTKRDLGPLQRARKLSQKLLRQDGSFTTSTVWVPPNEANVSAPKNVEVIYRISDKDSFEAAEDYKNPLVLVFASNFRPGGGFLNGVTHTQEENLCCRSTLYDALARQRAAYPLQGKLIYVPKVRVFADQKLLFLKRRDRFTVSCVVAAAPKNPRLNTDGTEYALASQRTGVQTQIRMMLSLAHMHGHDAVVLGAWGCGVYHNPPAEIVKAYRREIDSTPFTGEIVFSVFGGGDFKLLISCQAPDVGEAKTGLPPPEPTSAPAYSS